MEKTEEVKHTQEGRLASEFIQSLLRSKKNLKLYPTNNPIYAKMVEETHKKLEKFLEYKDALKLTITRGEIMMEEEVVYKPDGKDENLALFFFRDGLRNIAFEQGIAEEETRLLLEVISVDFDSPEVEEDLITLLWEKDFQHVKYKVDESVLSEDENFQERAEEKAKENASTEEGLHQAHEEAESDPDDFSGIVPVPILDGDISALEKEIDHYNHEDKLPKLVDVLYDMLFLSETVDEFKDIARILRNAAEFSVKNGNFEGALSIFKRTGEILSKTKSQPVKENLAKVIEFSSSPTMVRVLGEWLDTKKELDQNILKEYLNFIGPEAIPQFINMLGELKTIGARKYAIHMLAHVGKRDLKGLSAGLEDQRWYVVRNMIIVFKQIGDRRFMDYIARVKDHDEPRVQKELVKVLGEMGGPKAIAVAAEYLETKEHSVKVVAAQALARTGSTEAQTILMTKILDKGFQQYEVEEMKPFFDALARFRNKQVFAFFMDMLDKNPLFGRAKHNELKACAIYALGVLGSPSAIPKLEEYRGSKIKMLAEQAVMAIKRIQGARKK